MTRMNRASMAVVAFSAIALGCADRKEQAAPAAAPTTAPASATSAMVSGMAHADHAAKHGGIFFMAPDKYHHVEGTYPETRMFRLYLYDDHTRPLDPQGVTGTVHVEGRPDDERIPLTRDAQTMTLDAVLEPAPALPMALDVLVMLPDPVSGATSEALFNFDFGAVGDVPAGPHSHADGEHSHVAPHGGEVASVGSDYHFELVDSGSMFTLWILDAAEKELPVDGMKATLLLQPKAGAPKTITLDAMGSAHFMANNPLRPGESAVAIASVTMDGTTRTARFTVGSGS